MRTVCPECGAEQSLVASINDAEARKAFAAVAAIPGPIGGRVVRYLGLFRPRKRVLAWAKATQLVNDLREQIESARVVCKGQTVVAPLPAWVAGIDQLFEQRDRLDLPLKNHGYLCSIVADKASQMDATEIPLRQSDEPNRRPVTFDTKPAFYKFMSDEQRAEYDRNQAELAAETGNE